MFTVSLPLQVVGFTPDAPDLLLVKDFFTLDCLLLKVSENDRAVLSGAQKLQAEVSLQPQGRLRTGVEGLVKFGHLVSFRVLPENPLSELQSWFNESYPREWPTVWGHEDH